MPDLSAPCRSTPHVPPNALLVRLDETVYVLAAEHQGIGTGGNRVFPARTRRLLLAVLENALDEVRNSVDPS